MSTNAWLFHRNNLIIPRWQLWWQPLNCQILNHIYPPFFTMHEDVKKALDELLRINDTSIIEVWTHTHTHTQTQQALLSQSGLGIKFCWVIWFSMCLIYIYICGQFVFLHGLHILWTPQKKNEVLSLKEFRENYPSLKVLFQSVPAQVLGNDNWTDISRPSDSSIQLIR